ncbi:MAG: (d)CMP kinase [Patescibacteria group bacterium]|nr:(d)CMP kinase [Patescibacteria group bacterium]
MIISISGPAGSGKSTVAKMLAKKLDWSRYYIGGLRRAKAKEKGMTLTEYNKLGETDPSTDIEVDEYQTELGKNEDNFVIEGRTSWHFIPQSLKIYLNVDEAVGAKRIFDELQKENERNEDKNLNTVDDVIKSHKKRSQSDDKRYKKYFNINVHNLENYDLVVDTSELSRDEVLARVWDEIGRCL